MASNWGNWGDWILSAALLGVFLASIPTGWSILKDGNAADPLRREIERENHERLRDRGIESDEDAA